MKFVTILTFICLFIVTACEKNAPPSISSLESDTDTIVGGSEVQLNVSASDENGDILSYQWSANGGAFLSKTDSTSVMWKAPLPTTNETYLIVNQPNLL